MPAAAKKMSVTFSCSLSNKLRVIVYDGFHVQSLSQGHQKPTWPYGIPPRITNFPLFFTNSSLKRRSLKFLLWH
jgi:hypothetical protein